MPDSAPDHGQLVFGHLNGLVRASTLYPPTHPQTVKAREALHGALTAYLAAHGTLTYWFLGDVLVANERILARESLVYRRLLETCQKERHIGSITFSAGVAPREQILQIPDLVLRLASIKSYDEYTLYHSVNVAVISIGLGLVLDLPGPLLHEVGMAGMLHDLGKIAIPLEILRKPGPLNEEEWRIMQQHPLLGAEVLSRLSVANRLPMVIAFEHHMRFDGKG